MMSVATEVLRGFDDLRFSVENWEHLLTQSGQDVVSLTPQWQRTWWETLGRGDLLLIVAYRNSVPIALAPFFVSDRVVYFIGSRHEVDYVDFVGDVTSPGVLEAILDTARQAVPRFLGFALYFLPDWSPTAARLAEAAAHLNMTCEEDWSVASPIVDLTRPAEALRAAKKDTVVRHEKLLRREGDLHVRHLRHGDDIEPHLPSLFEQHLTRWQRFSDPTARLFIEQWTRAPRDTGWLRFTILEWNGRPIAYHYGTCYRGRYVLIRRPSMPRSRVTRPDWCCCGSSCWRRSRRGRQCSTLDWRPAL